MNKIKKIGMACTGGCALVLLIIYGIGIFYFSKHLFANTSINEINCSMLSADEAISYLDGKIEEYTLHIIGRNNLKQEISGQEVDLKVAWTEVINQIVENQNKYEWPKYLISGQNYNSEYVISLNEEKLFSKIKNWNEIKNKNAMKPENAQIGAYSEAEKQYILEVEKQGSYLIEKNVYESVKEAMLSLKTELDLEEEQCYLKPRIDSTDKKLLRVWNEMNQYVSTEIIYDFGTQTEILDGDIIHEWITKKNYVVDIDEEAVANYVKELANKYDTAYRKHNFKTADGNEIVISQGHYGWWMNRKEETKELLDIIRSGTKETRTPVYYQKAASYEQPDYGDNYVEIDLGKQHLYLWKDGKIILESDFVSGNLANGNATPEGIYPITYKERNTVLRGTGYASPVSYWMPFNGDIGMHDASWRKSFGGSIYKTNGSHGCVNLPVDIAQQIYEEVYTGMAVICYYSSCE